MHLCVSHEYINKIFKKENRYKDVKGPKKSQMKKEGSLGGAAVWRLPLARGAVLDTRDRIPRQAPGAWSLLLPLPVSLPLSLTVFIYL